MNRAAQIQDVFADMHGRLPQARLYATHYPEEPTTYAVVTVLVMAKTRRDGGRPSPRNVLVADTQDNTDPWVRPFRGMRRVRVQERLL